MMDPEMTGEAMVPENPNEMDQDSDEEFRLLDE